MLHRYVRVRVVPEAARAARADECGCVMALHVHEVPRIPASFLEIEEVLGDSDDVPTHGLDERVVVVNIREDDIYLAAQPTYDNEIAI